MKTPRSKAVFKAYFTSDRDLLINRLVGIPGWDGISQATASPETNMIECTVYFRRSGKRLLSEIRKATLFGAWRIQSFE